MLTRFRSHYRKNVVAYLALFVALGGTANAVKPLITGDDVEDDSLTGADVLESSLVKPLVTGADVKDDSLTEADVLESSLGQVPHAERAFAANSAGGAGETKAVFFPEGTELFKIADVAGLRLKVACAPGTNGSGPISTLEVSGVRSLDLIFGYKFEDLGKFTPIHGTSSQTVTGKNPAISVVGGTEFEIGRLDAQGSQRFFQPPNNSNGCIFHTLENDPGGRN